MLFRSVDPAVEFIAFDVEPSDAITHPVARHTYAVSPTRPVEALQRVLAMTRPNPPKAIVVSSYQDARPARWLADQLGASTQVLQLPATVTDDAVVPDLNALFDLLVNRLEDVLLNETRGLDLPASDSAKPGGATR